MTNSIRFTRVLGAFVISAMLLGGYSMLSGADLHAAPQIPSSVMVDINKADLDELQTVRGIGPSLAQRILDYREEFGTFETVDDLSSIRGIGGSRLQKIKEQITL